MKELALLSPAKINLFLHITGRRDDGYHHLHTVFRALDFGDTLTFRPKSSGQLVQLIGAEGLTDTLEDNLIVKAVQTLAKRFPAYASAVQIVLEKTIPTGAGLGGGSSNCATTLVALNELWGLHLGERELIHIGASLGADVPFFVFAHLSGQDAVATGIGELLCPIQLPAREYLLLTPNVHLSTASLFANDALVKNTPIIDAPDEKTEQFLDKLIPPFFNAFESLACERSHEVAEALAYLRTLESQTGTTARLTGTGSAVFLPIIYALNDTTRHAFVHNAPCPARIVSSLF